MDEINFESMSLPLISAGDILVFRVETHFSTPDRLKYREYVQSMLDEAGIGDRKFLVIDRTMDVSVV